MIIAIDFDGTIAIDNYPKIGVPVPYAIETIRKIKKQGHYIIINTCRCGDRLIDAVNWMTEKGVMFDRVNDNHPIETAKYDSNSRKVFAHLYIDDRQIGGLPTWPEIYDHVIDLERRLNMNR